MQPAHEDMRADARAKLKAGHGDIGDCRLEVSTSGCRNSNRHFAGESQDDRNIVGSKTPKNIFLASYFSEVEPRGVNVSQFAKLAGSNQFGQPEHRGMIFEEVADHKDHATRTG